jgi:demethylmenaquinone methyltransferase/2-methoxy-6-polyprenyl-1,4-benzoquinol methylase
MSDSSQHERLLTEQIDYYKARAGEYDDWCLRRGRYDYGAQRNQEWFDEVEQVRQALGTFQPLGQVLELAAGTGWWTEQLLRYATHITAVDAAAETIALNRARVQSDRVHYEQADIFAWQPPEPHCYDVVFFSFWLSHVPPERFEAFWDLVRAALKPEGRVFLIDSRFNPASTARDHRLENPQGTTAARRLNDGRTYEIIKRFYEPRQLEEQLATLGWQFEIRQTAQHFIYGAGQNVLSTCSARPE